MKTTAIEKFAGLAVQQNSFTVTPGAFERAENVTFGQDFVVTKRRGFKYTAWFQDDLNSIFSFRSQVFALASNYMVRLDPTEYGEARAFAGSTKIVVRKAAHGITHNDYIAEFVASTEAFVSQYAERYAAFCGIHQVVVAHTGLTASGNGSSVFVALPNHGLQAGDSVSAASSTFGVTLGAKAIAVCGANVFTFLDGATGTGTVTVNLTDAFSFDATQNAAASGITSATGASWGHYERLSGTSFTVSDTSLTLRANNNLYFTTDNGLFCLESAAGTIREAGIPPGLDLDGALSLNTGGVNANAQCAWRVVFGLKDTNDNLHLGAPSETLILTNPLTDVTSANLAYVSGTNTATITVSAHGLSSGDEVFLWNVVLTPATAVVPDDSRAFCTSLSPNTFSVDFDDLGVVPTGVTSLSYGTRKTATIYASIPSEVVSSLYKFQIYRVQSIDALTIPEARYKFVDERTLTAAEVSAGFLTYVDQLPEELVEGNAELYTNPTQEGEDQANSRPPLSADVTLFKNYTFFASNTQYRSLALAVVAPSSITHGDLVEIAGTRYEFMGDSTNTLVANSLTTSPATTSTYVEITQVGHGFIAGDTIYVISSTGLTGLAAGSYAIASAPTADTFRFGAATGSGTVTYEGRSSAVTGYTMVKRTISTTTTTLSEAIDSTARALVKACNRNTATTLYAQYVSAPDEAPGNILFTAKNLDLATFAAIASSVACGSAFTPDLPITGTTVSDTQDVAPNELLVSKYLEPEGVPGVNKFPVGSKESSILRIAALRDSLIILKADGVFRLNGDSPANFVVTQLDATVILLANRSVAVMNNSVYCLTNQGVVQISDTSVRIVSRPIEPLFTAIFGKSNLSAITAAVAYESDRLYLLSTIDTTTNPTAANITFAYHYLTDTWSTYADDDVQFYAGLVDATSDQLYLVESVDQSIIVQERKDNTKVDFTAQDQCLYVILARVASASSTASSTNCRVVTTLAHGLKVGNTITISRCDALLAAAYSGGVADINGIRVITAVSAKSFSFAAGTASTGSAVGSLYWQKGICEQSVSFTTDSGSAIVSGDTVIPHGYKLGDALNIDTATAALTAGFASASSVLGYRTVSSIPTTTTFTFVAGAAATSTVTGDAQVTDTRKQRRIVTALITAVQPQVGDCLVAESRLYKITAVNLFSTGVYLLSVDVDYKSLTTAECHLHDAFKATIKFAPITAGTGVLKAYSEFQAWFRNQSSCSAASIFFSTDSFIASPRDAWTAQVGTPAADVVFGGWGQSPWGRFPWGGGTNIDRDYRTGAAVIWRMYVPFQASLATWIQPQIEHSTGGEPFELQSIALLGEASTPRTSK